MKNAGVKAVIARSANEASIQEEPMKQPAVYIMANKRNGTLYTGVTSNLPKRVHEHNVGLTSGFSSRYGCKRLVYFEIFDDMEAAIAREKQIKAGSRQKKITLIEVANPNWHDLSSQIL
jgi:putative endonuclease